MAKTKQIKIPDKKTMNLYQANIVKGNSVPKFVLGLICIGLAVVLISQFGVITRLNSLNKLQSEVNAIQSQVNAYQQEMLVYPEVKEEYLRYSNSYTTDTMIFVDRVDILNTLEKACSGLGDINSVNIIDNTITVKVTTKSLSDFDRIKMYLDSSELVKSVTPVSHDDTSIAGVVSSVFKFTVTNEEAE